MPEARAPATKPKAPASVLVVATIGFVICCWAWALLSPLGPLLRQEGLLGTLTETDVSLLVAVPVVVGSLGRIVVGALTDVYGGRMMFPIVSALTIIPVLFIGLFALDSYALMIVGGIVLGLGGTVFAVGVPLVNGWFPPERRGFALGVFGAGMGGTAISALTTVPLFVDVGQTAPFLITAAALAVYAVLAWLILRDPPGRTRPTGSLGSRLLNNARLPITWQGCALYAVAFGGYVSFSVYLPQYLRNTHNLTPTDASARMAGFVVIAVILRPVGGWLADRIGAIPVLAGSFALVTVCAAIAAGTPPLDGIGTVVFLLMAAALGAGSGATFGLISGAVEPARVGGVTGIVGAAGGFGGFVPPLLMGYVYGTTESYAIGLWLLAATSAAVLILTVTVVRHTVEAANKGAS